MSSGCGNSGLLCKLDAANRTFNPAFHLLVNGEECLDAISALEAKRLGRACAQAALDAAATAAVATGPVAGVSRAAGGLRGAAKDAALVVRGGSQGAFDIAPRVFGQLGNPRLGRLAGRLSPGDLERLANAASASRYLDARTGNINVIQNVHGVTLRITTPRDAMRIISVGPIRARQVANRVAAGDFIPLP